MSDYSVEQIDEDAMTEFIQSKGCRREILAHYMDGGDEQSSCSESDGVFCDRCRVNKRHLPDPKQKEVRKEVEVEVENEEEEVISGAELIANKLQELEASQEGMIDVMTKFQGGCVYCGLIYGEPIRSEDEEPHAWENCVQARDAKCGMAEFKEWRGKVFFETRDIKGCKHCWSCGLSQRMCRRLEKDGFCEYPDMMLPGIFILQQSEQLHGAMQAVGFRGEYPDDMWEWLKETEEGFQVEWENNWMAT